MSISYLFCPLLVFNRHIRRQKFLFTLRFFAHNVSLFNFQIQKLFFLWRCFNWLANFKVNFGEVDQDCVAWEFWNKALNFILFFFIILLTFYDFTVEEIKIWMHSTCYRLTLIATIVATITQLLSLFRDFILISIHSKWFVSWWWWFRGLWHIAFALFTFKRCSTLSYLD